MSDAEVAALQGSAAPAASVHSSAAAGFSLASILAWAIVGIPIMWGVWITLAKVAVLFT